MKLGKHHTDEAKEKIRQANLGKHLSEETKRKISVYTRTEEHNKKISESLKGFKHPNWHNGRINHHGYVLILKPDHPYADCRGYVREHRLVMEEFLGRYLLPKEIVHHENEILDDNRLENLKLFTNKSEHTKYHLSLRYMIAGVVLLVRMAVAR